MSAIYKNSVGVTIQVTLPDWAIKTGDASLTARLLKPDGSVLFKDTSDIDSTGWPLIVYTTKVNELDQIGLYKWVLTIYYTTLTFPLDPIQFRIWPSDREGAGT